LASYETALPASSDFALTEPFRGQYIRQHLELGKKHQGDRFHQGSFEYLIGHFKANPDSGSRQWFTNAKGATS
jgi:hypothetical protein